MRALLAIAVAACVPPQIGIQHAAHLPPATAQQPTARAPHPTARTQPRIVGAIPEAERTSETARYDSLPPYPSEPADPWAGVRGDQPVRWSEERARYWKVRANAHACTAAADHCLLPEAWFLENDEHRRPGALRAASLHVFGPHGPIHPGNASNPFRSGPYTAYRSVPATRANLVPGALAIVFPRPYAHPEDGRHAIEKLWQIAPVESVDHELGTVKLVGHADTHLLSAARVVVMTWQPNGTIKVVGRPARVSQHDVFLPQ